MEFSKHLLGSVTTAGAAGTVPLNHGRPRPTRENAQGVTLTDGPYDYVDVQRCERISVNVVVDVGTATVTLEGTNGDPNDPATPWAALDSTGALDGSVDAVADMLLYEGRIRFARVTWASATDDPTISVELFAGN